jgi:hypothetical protein
LQHIYSCLDSDNVGKLSGEDIDIFTSIMGVNFITKEQIMKKFGNQITFSIFKDLLKDVRNLFSRHEGRFFVLLSLQEAEHFRAIIHSRHDSSLLPSEKGLTAGHTNAGLWILQDDNATLFGSSLGFKQSHFPQQNTMINGYRFLNSDAYYDERSLTILLRMLEGSSCEDRERWWLDVRSCRRRAQVPIDKKIPIFTLFHTPSEHSYLEFRAIIERMKKGIQEKGMLVYDAFKAMNSSNSGLLNCSELYGGIDFFGIPFTTEQVHNLARRLAVENEGLISYEDFKRAFRQSEEDIESRALVAGASNFTTIPPKPIAELTIIRKKNNEDEEDIVLTGQILQNFKVKINPVGSFEKIWTSEGTNSKSQASIWEPSMSTSMLQSNKTRVCLGHYAVKGFAQPKEKTTFGTSRYLLLEVTDNSASKLSKSKLTSVVLGSVFPHPLRYKQVWHMARGDKFLYAWKAIPPDNFVAMGMMITTSEDPPDIDAIRCVPAKWVTISKQAPSKIWDDSGSGGGKPGSIWTINSMDMIAVVPGYDPPKGEFYEMTSNRFIMDSKCRTEKGILTFD